MTSNSKFTFLVSTAKNILSKNLVLASITVSSLPNILKGAGGHLLRTYFYVGSF